MTISVRCPNGHSLTAKEKLAGKKVSCPKCGAQVTIPSSPAAPDDDNELRLEPAVSSRQTDDDVFDNVASAKPVRPSAGGKSRGTKQLGGKQGAASKPQRGISRLSPLMTALIGGGAVLTIIVAVTLIIMFTRNDDEITRAPMPIPPIINSPDASSNNTQPPVAPPTDAPPTNAAPPERADSTPPPPPPVVLPDLPTSPLDVVTAPSDPRLIGFQLPGPTWAASYDEPTGTLAVTHDGSGIVLYDVDYLLAGKPAVRGVIPTEGLPTAVCFKVVGEQRLLAIAGKDAAAVQVHNADSLEKLGSIALPNIQYVDYLAGSQNPEDPYVYYSTDQVPITDPSSRERPNRLGRVDLISGSRHGEVSGVNDNYWNQVTLSPDGALLYVGNSVHNQFSVMTWADRLDQWGGINLQEVGIGSMRPGEYVTHPFGNQCAVRTIVYSRNGWREIKRLDYSLHAYFRNLPFVGGVSTSNGNEFIVGSANDYRRLESIALPAEWSPKPDRRQAMDFRERFEASPLPPFFQMFADNQRQALIAVFPQHVALLPLSKLNLPREAFLIAGNFMPTYLVAGQEVSVQLNIPSREAKVELVTTPEHESSDYRPVVPGLGVKYPPRQIPLAAAVNSEQDILFLNDVDVLKEFELPINIRIDDERMVIVAIDDFKDAVTIQRTNGVRHSVSSPIVIVPEDELETPNLPVIEGHTLRWTPNARQLGRHSAHFKTTLGKTEHHWYWDVVVGHELYHPPFFALGMEFDPQGQRAIVWGRQTGRQGAEETLVAIWDSQSKQFSEPIVLTHPVMSAAMDASGAYLSFNKMGPSPPGGAVPTQIVRLDPLSLQVHAEVDVPSHCHKLQTIGGRYLAALGMEGQTFRFTTPDLKLMQSPPVNTGNLSITAGRVGVQWIWDGIVWDSAMQQPQLLLYPSSFGARSAPNGHIFSAGAQGQIHLHSEGATLGTWYKGVNPVEPGFVLHNYPGTIVPMPDYLALFSVADSRSYSAALAERSQQMEEGIPLDIDLISGDRGPQREPDHKSHFPAHAWMSPHDQFSGLHFAETSSHLYAVRTGKIQAVPLEMLLPAQEPFQLQPQQTTFVLPFGKSTLVQYKAPQAITYYFQLRARLEPHEEELELLIDDSKKGGDFTINITKSPTMVALLAEGLANSFAVDGHMNPAEAFNDYVQQSTEAFRTLTGRDPKGVPLPLYATVIAETADGRRTGMVHAYLVEVPAAEVRAQLGRRNSPPRLP